MRFKQGTLFMASASQCGTVVLGAGFEVEMARHFEGHMEPLI